MDSNLLTFFVAVTSIAVVIQAGILVALFLTMRNRSARALAMIEQVQSRALPALESAQAILADAGPKVQTITSNLVDVTTTLKTEVERADLTVADLLDRTRLQIIRADELVSRAMDKVEETTELVQHSVISPVRQISAIIQGLTAGLGSFLGRRTRGPQADAAEQDEELFI
ncbi:MAG: hypothetical protein HYX28_03395 [Candidatus Koribacter versatilis]|uniref:DUF948 domain-containing protein n=1 Tax=Candidatus Korobacter versatilis TaxID=658062 RepID=A0A932ENK9_9BACT|nr:hypothetical protein [Candidatus Koribacter versatilis]